mmetsp:Transcript_11215/g.16827  ORF Transcript_11215/g.16827 Transcript_11215/m.16827 type:complete len:209 (+) Transcript_11215:1614-2240(+)
MCITDHTTFKFLKWIKKERAWTPTDLLFTHLVFSRYVINWIDDSTVLALAYLGERDCTTHDLFYTRNVHGGLLVGHQPFITSSTVGAKLISERTVCLKMNGNFTGKHMSLMLTDNFFIHRRHIKANTTYQPFFTGSAHIAFMVLGVTHSAYAQCTILLHDLTIDCLHNAFFFAAKVGGWAVKEPLFTCLTFNTLGIGEITLCIEQQCL